ncbi:Uncharacterised protein [uncultured archaeon]|nr:Uncharacterised protein [uncultured archaeon]
MSLGDIMGDKPTSYRTVTKHGGSATLTIPAKFKVSPGTLVVMTMVSDDKFEVEIIKRPNSEKGDGTDDKLTPEAV